MAVVRNILVTGGAGYIGSHTCKALRIHGYTPITYDNLSRGHREAVKWGPLEIGDLADQARLGEVMARYNPEAIIHFAALAYVGESIDNPGKYYRNNVAGTLSLLDAAHRNGIEKIVFSSTCATYGVPDRLPISEASPQQPINPYGMSKLMVERVLSDYQRAYGLRAIVLRYFNAAGADPEGEVGESHSPETHLVPIVIDVALRRRDRVTIFGADYDTHDGTCIRDYVHVSDLADAHVLALRRLEVESDLLALNLGNGRGFSVREVIAAVERATGTKIVAEYGPRRPGDPACLIASAEKAQNLLGWHAKFSRIDQIIDTAVRWHRNKKY